MINKREYFGKPECLPKQDLVNLIRDHFLEKMGLEEEHSFSLKEILDYIGYEDLEKIYKEEISND